MPEPALATVERLRPSAVTAAALHPLHYGTLIACSMVLLMTGCVLSAGLFLLVDAVLMALLPHTGLCRQRLRARAAAIARRRAGDRLAAEERVQWRELELLALRTEPLNARKIDLEELLTTYLNVALMLGHARECVTGARKVPCSERTLDDAAPELLKLEAKSARRSDDAVARLEHQLATTAALIRNICEDAVATHVDAVANLWAADVAAATQLLPNPCEEGSSS